RPRSTRESFIMDRRVFIALMLLGSHAALYAGQPAPASRGSAWAEIRQAMALSRATDQLVLLVFSADRCSACRRLDAALREPQTAAALRRHLRLVTVDVGEGPRNRDVAQRYGVDLATEELPVIVALDPHEDVTVPVDL